MSPTWWSAIAESGDLPKSGLLDRYRDQLAEDIVAPLAALGAQVVIEGADQDALLDGGGERYLDLRCGGGTTALGHRPAAAIAALAHTMAMVDMGDRQLPSELRALLAADLGATMSQGRWRWQFCAGGSEAVEIALRTAMAATGRNVVATVEGGYHGQSGLAAAVSDPRHLAGPFPQLSAVPLRIAPDCTASLGRIDDRCAAVIVEPVQLTDQIRPMSGRWLLELRRHCDRTGTLLLFDEIKCGLNRCGPLWAHHDSAVTPDILVIGKALSAGVYPLAACGFRVDLLGGPLHDWRSPFRSSYGGSLLGMAVGRAALTQLTDPHHRRLYRDRAAAFEDELRRNVERAAAPLRRIRRHGMAFELRFNDPDTALFVAADLLHRRVLVPFPTGNCIVLLPPLTIADESMRLACERIAAAVEAARIVLGSVP